VTEPTSPPPSPPSAPEPAARAAAPAARTVLPAPPDTRTVPLTLLNVPSRQGFRWVREGVQVFVKRPLALAGLFAMFLFFALVTMLVPFLGPVLLLGSLPLVSLAFMLATQAVLNDRFPMPGIAIAPLRTDASRRVAMLQLGFLYALASFTIMALSDAVDGGKFEALQEAMARGRADGSAPGPVLTDPQLLFGLTVRLGLAVLLAVPFWHAPALVHWSGQGVLQSLFSSTVAVWRNRWAFLAYGLAWGALLGGFAFTVNMVGLLFGAPQLLSLIMMPTALMFSTVFYASLYFTFVDCFGRRETP
jgi:hypothetical protein